MLNNFSLPGFCSWSSTHGCGCDPCCDPGSHTAPAQQILSHLCIPSHFVQLLVDVVVVLVVLAELGDQGAVGQREQLRVLRTGKEIHTTEPAPAPLPPCPAPPPSARRGEQGPAVSKESGA